MQITNSQGRSFNVRIVREGERYGLDRCLTHNDATPLVEFYDAAGAGKPGFDPLGQFVSRYCADTLAALPDGVGINLCGYVPVWGIDGATLLPVLQLAREVAASAWPE